MKFKVGDRVQVLMSTNTTGALPGQTATIVEVQEDSVLPYCIMFSFNKYEWCGEHDIAKLTNWGGW